MKKPHKGVIVVCTVMTVAVVTYFVLNIVFSPYWDSVYAPTGCLSFASMRNAESDTETITRAKACEDIDYVVKTLKRVHPACIDGVPENVLAAAESVKGGFGDEVPNYLVWRGVARVLHEMEDAHTMAGPSFPMNYLTDYSDMLGGGAELESVNGKTAEEIFRANSDYVSYELEPWGEGVVRGLCGTREGLKYLGITDSELVYVYRMADGSMAEKTYTADDFYNYKASQEPDETADSPYSSEIMKDRNAAVMKFDECVFDMELKEFMYKFFTDVAENSIDNIILDLRGNSGGTSQILDEFLKYIDRRTFRTPGGDWRLGPYMMHWDSEETKIINMDVETLYGGSIYVLTDSGSFSSSTLIAETLSDNGFAKVVGEECGSMPEGYGEVAVFQTPNAAVSFQVSTKHFERIDRSKADRPLMPDIECRSAEALEKALEDISR